jgi:prevent-host-death family protein
MSGQAVNIRELRAHLADYLRRARQGAEFNVTLRGKVVARIGPPAPPAPRRLGLLKGKIRMAPDFDETPHDIIAAMEDDDPET